MAAPSCILYRNNESTVFLIDIPTSIALAQHLPSPSLSSLETGSTSQDTTAAPPHRKQLYSTPALTTPFPSPPEPKSDAARARLLARIPVSERRFHEGIVPFVRQGLEEIGDRFEGVSAGAEREKRMWCLPRKVIQGEEPTKTIFSAEESTFDYEADSGPPAKQARTSVRMGSDDGCHITRPSLDVARESKVDASGAGDGIADSRPGPPLILSPTVNEFESLSELRNVEVRNPSSKPAVIRAHCPATAEESTRQDYTTFNIPPESCFVLCELSSQPCSHSPIPGLPENRKFNLILLDPPWPNRSVRRAAKYATHPPFDMDGLSRMIRDIILRHLHDGRSTDPIEDRPDDQQSQPSIVAIWVTNKEKSRVAAYDAIRGAGLSVCEEWVWIKTTIEGEPVTPLEGLWRKPYEVLVIGKRDENRDDNRSTSTYTMGRGTPNERSGSPQRRLIAGVPDVHSRKPNLKEIFETVFFSPSSIAADAPAMKDDTDTSPQQERRRRTKYSALEVFARNLTAGWCACGDEALKFNCDEWWVEE
ncbi:hypothetical protein VTN77DRAFT_6212 [Rasamsonia byssochlamydoides]|uniref:uncharacterized protein n=1 Tax=Rasamsonia byssochlamydoides TaxID=89139 RepID=UPI0037433154